MVALTREPVIDMLAGGQRNSLGRTEEVVEIVVGDAGRLDELFACLDSPDELIRLRAGDALEKVCRERADWFLVHVDRFLDEIGRIEQPSVQWHTAQILDHLRLDLSAEQRGRATELVCGYLDQSDDWIVLSTSAAVLTGWASCELALVDVLRPRLERLTGDRRSSVARRAGKLLDVLDRTAGTGEHG